MVKKCYVMWPDTGQYSGPYEIDAVDEDIVTINIGNEFIALPKALTIDDGWTVWEGGECPVAPDAEVEVVLRDGEKLPKHKARWRAWYHGIGRVETDDRDIIAYRVVDDAEQKTLDQAWDDCGEGMPEQVPERIYLQWHGDAPEEDDLDSYNEDVTWAENKVFERDVQFIRADVAEDEKKAAVAREREACAQIAQRVSDDHQRIIDRRLHAVDTFYHYQEGMSDAGEQIADEISRRATLF
jgi:hypothetical protein